MHVLGLDIGEKRIGIAFADTNAHIASPVRVLNASEVIEHSRAWSTVLEDYEPELLVFGFPQTMQGSPGSQAQRVRNVAESIASKSGLPYEFVDERLSSAEAKRILREQGFSEREMRGKIDSVAASLFLETWLDAKARLEVNQ